MSVDPLTLPPEDFADARFDRETGVAPRTLLLILSTPRSGSTLACNILHQAGHCTAHEYFQPFQVRPAMAARWGLADSDDAGYVAALARWRTSPGGVLGLNLHAHHLPGFERARPFLPASIRTVRYLWISRRDKLAQAVSYEIARQTRQWSSAFDKTQEPDYDHDRIQRALTDLEGSDAAIRRHLWRRGQFIRPLLYEEFSRDPGLVLKAAGSSAPVAAAASIQRQGGALNAAMIERFRREQALRGGEAWRVRLKRVLGRMFS
jgi:LPS sulfotransferase NodH